MKTAKLVFAAVVLAGATAAPLAVHADRNLHIPGTACTPIKADVGKIGYTGTSAVNESTSQATVVCPINYQSDTTHRPSNLFMRVIDRNRGSDSTSANNVSCTVYVFTHDGPGTVFSNTAKSKGALNDPDPSDPNPIQDIDAPGGDEGINVISATGLVYSMTCKIPGSTSLGRSEIVDYQLSPVIF